MLKFSHSILILLSGALWLGVGLYLMPLGINFLMSSLHSSMEHLFLFQLLASIGLRGEQAILILIAMGLLIGFIKSRAVFSKVVEKGVAHIRSLPPKASIFAVYTPRYFGLLGLMMLLGFSLKWLQVPADFRGLVDVAIGSALINGATLYFRKLSPLVKN